MWSENVLFGPLINNVDKPIITVKCACFYCENFFSPFKIRTTRLTARNFLCFQYCH
uniref:Uncharacterized protein n=1 Tax=Anguilla anguilla TaxID=7936 RepID=A0A0E9RA55_ANGAN